MNTKLASVVDKLIAERVRASRLQLGLTQSQLAQKLGVTFQQVQKYEKGVNRIGAGRLYAIAQVFDVPVQALFPESADVISRAENRTRELTEISEFVGSADGWRLCHAFLGIKDEHRRRKVLALVQEITET
jgi:transcriptional regulator with XRE-family HTH domain